MTLKAIILIILTTHLFSDNNNDIIHLKNGEIIYGEITEYEPNEYYYIQTNEELLFISYKDIDIINMQTNNKEDESAKKGNANHPPDGGKKKKKVAGEACPWVLSRRLVSTVRVSFGSPLLTGIA